MNSFRIPALSAFVAASQAHAGGGDSARAYFSAASRLLLVGQACSDFVPMAQREAAVAQVRDDLHATGFGSASVMKMISGLVLRHGPEMNRIIANEAQADRAAAEIFCVTAFRDRQQVLASARLAAGLH